MMNTSEDIAGEQVRERWAEIKDELKLVNINFQPQDVFATPKVDTDEGTIKIRHQSRVVIEVTQDVPDVLGGRVGLEVAEHYTYDKLKNNSTDRIHLKKYSYQFSYMPELLIESNTLQGSGRGHWGDLLLTQKKFYRFDGEDSVAWESRDLKYRNEHFVNHFHPGAFEFMRWPLKDKPTVLSVACFILFSFSYEKWLVLARSNSDVLIATKILLPHVGVVQS